MWHLLLILPKIAQLLSLLICCFRCIWLTCACMRAVHESLGPQWLHCPAKHQTSMFMFYRHRHNGDIGAQRLSGQGVQGVPGYPLCWAGSDRDRACHSRLVYQLQCAPSAPGTFAGCVDGCDIPGELAAFGIHTPFTCMYSAKGVFTKGKFTTEPGLSISSTNRLRI